MYYSNISILFFYKNIPNFPHLIFIKHNLNGQNMKIKLSCLIAFIICLISVNLLNPVIVMSQNKYEKEWESIDSLEMQGLPKSALEIADRVYNQAKAENNPDQLIKAYIYKMKFRRQVEEKAYINTLKELEEDTKTVSVTDRAIMHSMLAEMYWWYYQDNRWKFYDRSSTINFDQDSLETWDLDRLSNKVIKLYQKSLEADSVLQATPISKYNESIVDGTLPKELRPTLYDFLANKAIRFFSGSELSLTKPAEQFVLSEEKYFAPAEVFAKLNITTVDTFSRVFYAVKIYQDLIKFWLNSENTDALLDVDLNRLQFIHTNSVNPGKDIVYFNALQDMEKKYSDSPVSADISYLIADFYFKRSSKYQPLVKSTEEFKADKVKAMEIFKRVIDKFPDSRGVAKCKYLEEIILRPSLLFDIEKVVIPEEIFPIKINYRNFEKVYIRVAAISRSSAEKIYKKYYEGKYRSDSDEKYFEAIKKASKEVKKYNVNLPVDNDYNDHSLEYLVDGLPAGYYVVMVANNEEFTYKKNIVTYSFITASNISYIERELNNGSLEFYVLNRETSEPIPSVLAKSHYHEYNYKLRRYISKSGQSFTTNANGRFVVPAVDNDNSKTMYFEFEKDNDYLSSDDNFYLRYSDRVFYTVNSVKLFTDRAIYRPGQTVYFKGIMLKTDGEKSEILPNSRVSVTFNDVNYQEISNLDLTTNEFGTFSGSFAIPTGLLNGQMQLHTDYGSTYISVEEYKRPKFEVEILPFKGNYRLNDSVEVSGNALAYSGANLTEASVKYRITREPLWRGWWYYYLDSKPTEIANGTLTTDENGKFNMKFKAIPDLSMPASDYLVFNYRVSVDITDINGEMRSASKSMVVGNTALQLNLDILEQIDKANKDFAKKGEFKLNTQNLNGEFIPAQGSLKVYKLTEFETHIRQRYWSQPDKYLYSEDEWKTRFPNNVYADETNPVNMKKGDLVLDLVFNTEKEKHVIFDNIKKWKSGQYIIELTSKDFFGKEVENKQFFTLFSSKEKELPFPQNDWYFVVNDYAEPGEKAQFIIGTSEENTKILYEIELHDSIIQSQWLTLSNAQKLIEIPVKEEYRGNFSVHFIFIKNNRVYSHSDIVTVPYTNKELDIEFSTFRNKLMPGQKEEWLLKIKGKNGDKVAAEMMATLYDASLDEFRKNYWSFNIYNSFYTSLGWRAGNFGVENPELIHSDFFSYHSFPGYSYDYFNWFGFSYYSDYLVYDSVSPRSSNLLRKRGRNGLPKMAEKEIEITADFGEPVTGIEIEKEMAEDDFNRSGKSDKDHKEIISPEPSPETADLYQIKARTNFNETAFFYPHLQTDEEGNVIIKFTIPESLTKWSMMGFAHTKDLKYGFTENSLITQKDLMVMPNPPRFFRENDEIEFPVKISNISGIDLSGIAQLELFDAVTMQPLANIKKIQKPFGAVNFEVKAGQNASLKWKLKIPEGVGAITYRVVAKAGDFSDGEEKAIPVLSDRMLVTESMPLPVRGKQTKEFKFEKLVNSKSSKTLRHEKLTLEFTSNPAWYAVQALPYLMEYPYECTEQTFSRYYANSLASHIANSNPKIKRVFDSWKNTPGSTALLSNLEKNQELKSVLLEETPWVLKGQNETDRKHRIALLFDLNRMADELDRAMQKLQQSQSSNGGWPWFKGMPESWYITQHIVCGMGHLNELGVKDVEDDDKVRAMTGKAIDYLDDRIREAYNYQQKACKQSCKESNEKKCYDECMAADNIGYTVIHYLYARSFFTEKEMPNRSKEAFNYYIGQAEKYWLNKSMYMQGMIALALQRFGKPEKPRTIVKSLRERSLRNEEMGMYWKDNRGGWFWYQAPVETHALMIEVFDEVAKDNAAVEDLKVWLLKQKQTQDWRTTKATVEAVYALLRRGADWLESDEPVDIKLGDITVNTQEMPDVKVEAGTGYFKTSWNKDEIKPKMGNVIVTKKNEGVAWGALYWQYFEQMDKITPHETPLKINKKLFVERVTDRGPVIEPIDKSTLKVGDKVIARIEIRVDRDMEYVHLKDMRASGFEPINVISRYKYQDGLGYYESTKDAATNFFMGNLPKGTYVFEYPLRVSHTGDFSNGISTMQCMYAPEFTSRSEGVRVKVE